MPALSYEEKLIVDFLMANPREHYGPMQIARKAGGRKQFEENPRWAVPLLPKLREMDLIAANNEGAYRYVTEQERQERMKKARKKADKPG